jgi:hypothetical protein
MAQLTFEEFRDQVASSLSGLPGKREEAAKFADMVALEVLAAYHPIPEAERRLDADIFKKGTFYAIPDEALDLLPSIAKAAFAAVTAGPLSAVPELVGILYRYHTLAIELDADEAAILRALRSANKSGQGALAIAEVRDRIDGIKLKRPLIDVLEGLSAKQTAKTQLVHEVNGRWTIGNV